MKKLFFILLALNATILFSQGNTTILPNEKLVYDASYNMGGLMTLLAQVSMETSEVKTSKSTLLHLKCKATTYTKWDTYFKIRDYYESYVNPKNLKPVLYKRNIDEGGYKKQEKYIFSYSKGNVKSTLTKKGVEKTTNLKLNDGTSDVVSTLYQLRNIDFTQLQLREVLSFTVLFDEKEVSVSIKLLGTQIIDAGPLGKKECYKVAVAGNTEALKGSEQNLIWFTADAKKIPALIKFKIPVGNGQLQLKSASGT